MERMNMSSPELPPGFRFHPTDQELIIHYLKKKVSSSSYPEVSIIADVDIYKFNPWDLPGKALFGENEWFFFSPRDRKYPNGVRPNRAAGSGYWKATGTDKPILTSNGSQCLGVKKALVFYKGRPPKGTKTSWLMLEYRLLDDTHHLHRLRESMRLDDWVLCRVRQKSNTQQNGESLCSSFGSFSPFISFGCLQGQEMFKKSDTLKDYYYDLQPCLMAPPESKEADEQELVEFQEVSLGYPISGVDSNSQPTMVSTVKERLEYIKKILSIGAFEELVPATPKKRLHVSSSNKAENDCLFEETPSPPKKRLHISSSNNAKSESIFEVSSPTVSASSQQSFQSS
ncbi:hypothetical protein Peur_016366 [Populus x canadensis]